MSGLSRMPETPKTEDVLNQWEFSEGWKKLVKKEDANYISEWTDVFHHLYLQHEVLVILFFFENHTKN